MLTATLLMLAALLADWLLGEPRRWHPLVGFGRLAVHLEGQLRDTPRVFTQNLRIRGILAVLVLLLPFTAVAAFLSRLPYAGHGLSLLMLYLTLGHRSLHDHARPVMNALLTGDAEEARYHAGRMVSRDSAALDIPAATTESVLENGNDAVFGALFWFLLAGGAGAVLYRLANTLDALWGYRNEPYREFGWAAARLDDALNFIPARLTALTYTLLGNRRQALHAWRTQAPAWDSPNAGPVMAAGAGSLTLILGGAARYQGEWSLRPTLGTGRRPQAADIERALRLVRHGVALWLCVLALIAVIAHA